MVSSIQPVDMTLLTLDKLFPPEQPSTKFDKIIDLVKALSSGTIVGAVGQAIETTAKVCATISSGQQRAKAVKYVRDAYEVKCQSEVEMARIQEQREKNQTLTLYIEKSFQERMDQINKEIIIQSRQIDAEHEKDMLQLQTAHDQAIRRMDNIAKEHLHSVDRKYAEIIRRNEAYCLAYRQYLKFLNDNKTSPGTLIAELSRQYMNIIQQAVLRSTTSLEMLNAGLEGAMKLLQFLGEPDNFFITFDKFISQKKMLDEGWQNGYF